MPGIGHKMSEWREGTCCRGANCRPLRWWSAGHVDVRYPRRLIGPWEYLQQMQPTISSHSAPSYFQPRTALYCTRPLYICIYMCILGYVFLGLLFFLLAFLYHLPRCVFCLQFCILPQIPYILYPLPPNYLFSPAFPRIYSRNGLYS